MVNLKSLSQIPFKTKYQVYLVKGVRILFQVIAYGILCSLL